MLLLRRMVVLKDGVYRANPAEQALLGYYANAISHLLGASAGAPDGAPSRGASRGA
jgi:hypothetical protein